MPTTNKPLTFGRWYNGNIATDDQSPAFTDGQILVSKTARMNKRAYTQLTKPPRDASRQRPTPQATSDVISWILSKPRKPCFLTAECSEGLDRIHAGEQDSWFNSVALKWLLDNVEHNSNSEDWSLQLTDSGVLLLFDKSHFVALLMPVGSPPKAAWVQKLQAMAQV